jgi:hypothetical protein
VIVDPFGSPTLRHDLSVFDGAFHLPAPVLRILTPDGAIPPFRPRNLIRYAPTTVTTLAVATAIGALAHGALVSGSIQCAIALLVTVILTAVYLTYHFD